MTSFTSSSVAAKAFYQRDENSADYYGTNLSQSQVAKSLDSVAVKEAVRLGLSTSATARAYYMRDVLSPADTQTMTDISATSMRSTSDIVDEIPPLQAISDEDCIVDASTGTDNLTASLDGNLRRSLPQAPQIEVTLLSTTTDKATHSASGSVLRNALSVTGNVASALSQPVFSIFKGSSKPTNVEEESK